MMLLNSCCGCISLQKGTQIIGTLSLISAILNAIFSGIKISQLTSDGSETEPVSAGLLMILKIFIVSLLIYVLIGGIFAGLMVAGSIKKISGYIFPWLAISFGGIVGTVCVCLAAFIVTVTVLPIGVFFTLVLFMLATAVIEIYFWLVVYSHYKEVVAEKYGHQTRPNAGKVLSPPQMNPYHNV